MNEILTWQEIENSYQNQWVQLIDFNWPEGLSRPKSGRVRIHASSRKEFNSLVLAAEPVDAARVYVGSPQMKDSSILRSNLIRMIPQAN